jgi:hypothetical protein
MTEIRAIRLVFFPKNISNLNCSIKVQLGDFIEWEGDLPPHCVQLLVYRCWSVIVGLPVLIAVTFFFGSSFRERRIEQLNIVLRTRWLFALHWWSAIDRSLVFSFEQEEMRHKYLQHNGTFVAIVVRYGSSTLNFFFLFFSGENKRVPWIFDSFFFLCVCVCTEIPVFYFGGVLLLWRPVFPCVSFISLLHSRCSIKGCDDDDLSTDEWWSSG